MTWFKFAGTTFVASIAAGIAVVPIGAAAILAFFASGAKLDVTGGGTGAGPNWGLFLPFLLLCLVAAAGVYVWIYKLIFRALAHWFISFWRLFSVLALALAADFLFNAFIRVLAGYGPHALLNLLVLVAHLALVAFLVYHWGRPVATVIPTATAGEQFCPSCGQRRVGQAPFCGGCGTQFA